MKKIATTLFLLAAVLPLLAQDIEIKRFERNVTNLIASTRPVFDLNNEACAVIRFFVRDMDYVIEPSFDALKREEKPGEIWLYVPRGTKRLSIKHQGLTPLMDYEIPVPIESKVTYDVEIAVTNRANKGHNVYVGAGYNIVSISGPALALGFDINHHNIELGAVLGLNKTDDLYFYDSNGSISGGYNYQAIRIQLRYGYDFKVADFFSVMPQVGAAYNLYNGKELVSGYSDYKSANSLSAFGAVRLVAALSNHFRLHITPEYDFGLYKDNKAKTLADFDSTFKSWTDGFNLNIGLMIFF